jgi:hypothetical protein
MLNGGKQVHIGIRISQPSGNTSVDNITIEHNHIKNLGGVGFSIQTSRNVIVRHNVIEATGYFSSDPCCGSAFYIGSPTTDHPIDNLEIYGNTIRDATDNAFDVKDASARNVSIHHNLIEKHVWGKDHNPNRGGWNDGLFILYGRNVTVHDNIVRDCEAGSSVFRMIGKANNRVLRNVVLNSRNSSLIRGNKVANLHPSEVAFNTFCTLKTYNNHGDGTDGINIHDNKINVPQSTCDVEVNRILKEMKTLDSQQIPSPPLRLHFTTQR